MLAERGRRAAQGAGSGGEARHDVVHRQVAGLRVRQLDQDLARGDVGMLRKAASSQTGPTVTSAASKNASASAWVRSAMKAETKASTASRLRRRAALVRKRGSSFSSGRPSAVNRRSAIAWVPVDSATYLPSRVR